MAAQGLYPDAPKPPCVVGYEVAGVVDALGERVPGLAAGQRVLAMTHFGGHADVVCVPAEQVLPIPDAMSFEEAAAIPVNYLTAYQKPDQCHVSAFPGRGRDAYPCKLTHRSSHRVRAGRWWAQRRVGSITGA